LQGIKTVNTTFDELSVTLVTVAYYQISEILLSWCWKRGLNTSHSQSRKLVFNDHSKITPFLEYDFLTLLTKAWLFPIRTPRFGCYGNTIDVIVKSSCVTLTDFHVLDNKCHALNISNNDHVYETAIILILFDLFPPVQTYDLLYIHL